jgi:predicted ATPase
VDRTFPGTFVCRAEELALLLAAEERVAKGKPAVLLVVGDAGIGKTRLLTEFVEQVRRHGTLILAGGCMEFGDVGLPYLPVVEAPMPRDSRQALDACCPRLPTWPRQVSASSIFPSSFSCSTPSGPSCTA